ncbi:MAG: competence/damage-inducible protein A, partial [Chloroflexi bacterium]|nr:competence/damage-inducible protein A [Chloroflexota bacterium]
MYGEIVSVGHELLMGEIVDTNTSYLAQRFVEAGITPRYASQVGDDLGHLVEAFGRAHARSDVVVSTGGLGPTSDDLTREAVAKVMGEEMRVDPASLVWLEGVFKQRGIEMPKTNIKQATLIPSATSIPNPTGTAPGWWVERDGRHIVLLPGPPRELQLMWEKTVGPRLARAAGGGVVVTRTIKTFGMTEGGIDEMLTHLFGRANPYLGIYARPDGIH